MSDRPPGPVETLARQLIIDLASVAEALDDAGIDMTVVPISASIIRRAQAIARLDAYTSDPRAEG